MSSQNDSMFYNGKNTGVNIRRPGFSPGFPFHNYALNSGQSLDFFVPSFVIYKQERLD